jgi:tRNA pseudouridine55 synthase
VFFAFIEQPEYMHHIFAVYKPKGPTSADIVRMVKRVIGKEKVGHAGTLDPLAEGVLVIGVGREATKQLATEVAKEKEYIATIKLGETSTTDDAEGTKSPSVKREPPSEDDISKVLHKFIGKIQQVPPLYCAVKVAGKEAYKYARSGKSAVLEPREVEIKNIKLIEYAWPFLKLNVVTGPGVYIRSLARDIGQQLNTGAYMAALERTRVGDFTKEIAIPSTTIDSYLQTYLVK